MEIGLVVLELVCEYISMLEIECISLFLLVNISVNQLLSEFFVEEVVVICVEYFVLFELVEIEIIEFIFIQDEVVVIRGLVVLKFYGFIFVLDDFGFGFLLFSYLCKFDFDVIKFDCSLVKGIDGFEWVCVLLNGIFKMFDSL